jgi:hypothetical protein
MSAPEITIMSLPDELLIEIAKIYINNTLDYDRWPCLHYTCKRFNKLADPIDIMDRIYFPTCGPRIRYTKNDDFCSKVPIRCRPKIPTIRSFVVDLSLYHGFDSITIYRNSGPTDIQPEIIWSDCGAAHVSILGYQHDIKFEYFISLRSLSLCNVAGSSYYDLCMLTQLQSLSISHAYGDTYLIPESVIYVILSYCKGLNYTEFANVDKLTISDCHGVVYSEIDNNIELSIYDQNIKYIWPNFKRIVNLHLSRLDDTITYIPYIKTLKKITIHNSNIYDITSIRHLEYIDIKGAHQLYSLPHMPNVEYASFSDCPVMWNKTFADMQKFCPKLKQII